MAKKSRKQRKIEKEKALRQIARQAGVSQKRQKQLSYSDLLSIAQKEKHSKEREQLEKQRKSRQRKITYEKRIDRKIDFLESLGINHSHLSKKQIDSIKIKDIQLKNVSHETYPFLFPSTFDYNETRVLPNGNELYFAYLDIAGFQDFEELLKDLEHWSTSRLLARLRELAELRGSYVKGSSESNGKAGRYKFMYGQHVSILDQNKDTRKNSREIKQEKNKKKWQKHPQGENREWQVLTTKTGRVGISEISGRAFIKIAVAIMDNVTEMERISFYNQFYDAVSRFFPEMLTDIPEPLSK